MLYYCRVHLISPEIKRIGSEVAEWRKKYPNETAGKKVLVVYSSMDDISVRGV
jgi:hypothetical protein